jgi:hypothetical protein
MNDSNSSLDTSCHSPESISNVASSESSMPTADRYQRPVLKVYGTLLDLTQSGANGPAETSGQVSRKKPAS